jgi:type IV fimbrial biogenesis protein FimT
MKKNTGFTLLELVMSMAIVAIMVTMAIPSMLSTVSDSRLTSQANGLVLSLNAARSESIKRGKIVAVGRTSTDWRDGWQVFVDENASLAFDAGEEVVHTSGPIKEGFTVTPTAIFADMVAYRPDGRSSSSGTFTFCSQAGAAQFRQVVIAETGRIQTEETGDFATACP